MSLINFDPEDFDSEDKQDLGIHLRNEGMGRVVENSPDVWKQDFKRVLDLFAQSGQPFTSEDITDVVGLVDSGGSLRNNAVGAMMGAAARRGLIRKTGGVQTSRHWRAHGREIREWIGIT